MFGKSEFVTTCNLDYIRGMVSDRQLLLIAILVLQGCASHSSKAISDLGLQSQEFNSPACQNARKNAWLHDDLKDIQLVGGPALLLIAGPLLAVPVLLANLGLSTADHLTANDIKLQCGATTLTDDEITQSIVMEAGFSSLTGFVIPSASASAIKPK
jgi:hypothetical protein